MFKLPQVQRNRAQKNRLTPKFWQMFGLWTRQTWQPASSRSGAMVWDKFEDDGSPVPKLITYRKKRKGVNKIVRMSRRRNRL